MYKTLGVRATFGSWDVEKVHAVVARSTFPSQNVQSTPCTDHFWRFRCGKSVGGCGAKHISKSKCWNTRGSDHFWQLRCRKSARRCGAKHISKSKCTKNQGFGPLLEVPMWKKCTPLWREAHFEVKMFKAPGVRTTFGGSDVASLRFTTLHYMILHYITLHYTPQRYTPLHSTTLHYTPLHSTTFKLRYTTPHYKLQLHNYTPLHSTTLHDTTLHYTTLRYLPLHFTTLHYTTLHYTTNTTTQLHSTTLHYTPLR